MGSFFLLLGFFALYLDYGINVDVSNSYSMSRGGMGDYVCILFLIGFGVKVPIWPFLS